MTYGPPAPSPEPRAPWPRWAVPAIASFAFLALILVGSTLWVLGGRASRAAPPGGVGATTNRAAVDICEVARRVNGDRYVDASGQTRQYLEPSEVEKMTVIRSGIGELDVRADGALHLAKLAEQAKGTSGEWLATQEVATAVERIVETCAGLGY